MTASTRRELRSAATSTSTTAIDLIRALTDARPIKPTSTRCLSARRPNPGRGSTYRRGNSVQTTAALSDLGEFDHRFNPEHRCRHWPSLWTKELGTPNNPAIRFARGTVFAATLVRDCYGLSGCWPPCTDLTGFPANGGFYFQAFDGSVTLPVAGYNYNSVWTPLLAGLPPAGMAASLAALVRPCSRPACSECWQGAPKTGARHVTETRQLARRNRHRYRQELVPHRWPKSARCHRAAAEMVAWPGGGPARQSAAVSDRHGGLRRRASPQSHAKGTWS